MATEAEEQLSRATSYSGLAVILLVAAFLRIWGLDYGLPHFLSRPDEEIVVGRAYTIFATGDWFPGTLLYPSLVMYLATVALGVYYGIGRGMGHYDVPRDLVFEIALIHPGLEFWICRWVSVLAGVGTVWAVYALSVAAFGRRSVGLVAALMMAVNPIHVRDSHFATVDITMTFFVVLCLVFSVRAVVRPSLAYFALAGVFAGLATSAKYNAGLVVLSIVCAAWYAIRSQGIGWTGAAKRLVTALASMTVAFALTSPYVLLRFRNFLDGAGRLRGLLYGGEADLALWGHLSSTLPRGLGWLLFVAAMWGAMRALRRRRPEDVVILLFLIPFFALVASVRFTLPRYVLPIVPLLVVLGVEAADRGVDRWFKGRWRTILSIATVVMLLVPGLRDSVHFNRLAARLDTRVQATNWIKQNVRPQTHVVLCKGYGIPLVNEDRRRPPAFKVEEKDCFTGDTEVPSVAEFLVTHEHRQLTSYSRLHPNLSGWLADHAELVATFDPYRQESEREPFFHGADAFYLPFAGFEALERGGPIVKVWALAASR